MIASSGYSKVKHSIGHALIVLACSVGVAYGDDSMTGSVTSHFNDLPGIKSDLEQKINNVETGVGAITPPELPANVGASAPSQPNGCYRNGVRHSFGARVKTGDSTKAGWRTITHIRCQSNSTWKTETERKRINDGQHCFGSSGPDWCRGAT